MQAKRNRRKILGRGKRKGGKKREKNIKRRGKRRVMEEKNKQREGIGEIKVHPTFRVIRQSCRAYNLSLK